MGEIGKGMNHIAEITPENIDHFQFKQELFALVQRVQSKTKRRGIFMEKKRETNLFNRLKPILIGLGILGLVLMLVDLVTTNIAELNPGSFLNTAFLDTGISKTDMIDKLALNYMLFWGALSFIIRIISKKKT
jgi:hypothetical protein